MTPLSTNEKLEILRTMLRSRLGDLREQSLIRQGKGVFHVSGMGHEALCALGRQMRKEDYTALYYRDRSLALSRGMTTYEIALEFFAKRGSPSGGRQIPGHYSSRRHNIWSLPSPVAANFLPACGIAWGMKLEGKGGVMLACCGDAATRQGDFYEAGSMAKEYDLPIIFLVEDNGLGISSSTEQTTPKGLRLLKEHAWVFLDGCDVDAVHAAATQALDHVRGGHGPFFIWCRTERISSHSSADDQRKYRSAEQLDALVQRCPISTLKHRLIDEGALTEEQYEALQQEIEAEVRADYQRALTEPDPGPDDLTAHLHGPPTRVPPLPLNLGRRSRLVDAVNGVFRAALEESPDYMFFGQDIADPKGGVFSLTKGLSTAFPGRVLNSPLAESTILGVGCGLASYGRRPVFEIQFVDFTWPGFNQLISNIATLRWRSFGDWACPAVFYAPYGGYLPGGGLWHSQANESIFAHIPGLKVAVPSTPRDAAGIFWTAMHGSDPVFVLIPKHMLWRERPINGPIEPIPLGKAAIVREGRDVTLVAWGNCVEIAEEAIDELGNMVSVELIDLRTVMPWDKEAVLDSVRRTGRLVVVQEDGETCSLGQAIISTISGDNAAFEALVAPPVLVSKIDVHIGFASSYEYGALPDKARVEAGIRRVMGAHARRTPAEPQDTQEPRISAAKLMTHAYSSSSNVEERVRSLREIRVPMLGEGITNARLVSLLKQPGDKVSADEAICELETDKALFPVESEFTGVLKEWVVEEDADVEVGQKLAILEVEEAGSAPVQRPAPAAPEPEPEPAPRRHGSPTEGGLPSKIWGQMKNVVPTHMSVKCPWGGIRQAREDARQALGKDAPSPTAMLAWCVVRAMERHPIFCCTINADDTLTHHENFDFGFAVSLENDALDTAVIPRAKALAWPDFWDAYNEALRSTRGRRPSSKARTPLIITSMGGFSVRSALPVVVPPAIATLFIGESHWELGNDRHTPTEQVELCLSFDHRWLNGVAGAAFLSEVKRFMGEIRHPVSKG